MCIVWVDRHVHKNGGTTVRALMRERSLADELLQVGTYAASLEQWTALAADLAKLTPPCSPALQRARVSIEVHEPALKFESWIRAAEPLRTRRRNSCCCAVFTSRVREPLAWYVSAWLWSGVEVRRYNHTFEAWAPPDLFSRLWLHGSFSRHAFAGQYKYPVPPLSAAEHERSLAMLHDLDLVWPVEAFDEGVQSLAEMLRLPSLASRTPHISPRFGTSTGRARGASEVEAVCPNRTSCERFVAEIAASDRGLYAAAVARYSQLQLPRRPSRAAEPFPPNSPLASACGNPLVSTIVRPAMQAAKALGNLSRRFHLCGIPDEDGTQEASGARHASPTSTTNLLRAALVRAFGLSLLLHNPDYPRLRGFFGMVDLCGPAADTSGRRLCTDR